MISQTKENRQNEDFIRTTLLNQGPLPVWFPHVGFCSVFHTFCFETKKPELIRTPYKGTCDGDNLEKAVWDALNGVLWHDDSWIFYWASQKVYWKEDGLRLKVRFYE